MSTYPVENLFWCVTCHAFTNHTTSENNGVVERWRDENKVEIMKSIEDLQNKLSGVWRDVREALALEHLPAEFRAERSLALRVASARRRRMSALRRAEKTLAKIMGEER